MKKFKCVVCDYVYEGDELPEDYECPLCGVGPDQFEEVTDCSGNQMHSCQLTISGLCSGCINKENL